MWIRSAISLSSGELMKVAHPFCNVSESIQLFFVCDMSKEGLALAAFPISNRGNFSIQPKLH